MSDQFSRVRDRELAESLAQLGLSKTEAFLQAAISEYLKKDERLPLSLEFVYEHLNGGQPLLKYFETDEESTDLFKNFSSGPRMTVRSKGDKYYEIDYGYSAGPQAGDGGLWEVWFNDDDRVEKLKPGVVWMS